MCSTEMTDKISDKMTSALLAMSLSYYYVMGEHVEKEERVDEILSTLLNCSKDLAHRSTEKAKGDYDMCQFKLDSHSRGATPLIHTFLV